MAGRHHEVVVIGAGIAGLRCAEQLIREKGVTDVLVVEALDRVGGRIHHTTDFIPGMIVDIGAELVHGANTSLRKMAEQQKWSVREIFTWAQGDGGPKAMAPDGGIGYYYLGDQKRMLAYDDKDAEFCAFNKAVEALGEIDDLSTIPGSASILDYFEGLNLSESMIKLAEAGYANTAGSKLEDISWRVTSRYESQLKKQVCGESRLQSTFARVVDYVKEGVDVQLQFAVRSIDYSDSETIIVTSTNDERISCSKLVVTVPVSVFLNIEYVPALPEHKRVAAQSFGMRRAAKVLMHFSDSFWPSNTHGVICSDSFVPEFWVNSTAGIGHLVDNGECEVVDDGADPRDVQYLVTGFCGAECAEQLLNYSEQEIVDRFLAQLDMIYGTEDEPKPATKCFVRGMYFDWGNVEYIRGGYGFPRVGSSDHAAKDLASTIDDRIFFAGEATAYEQPGMTVHSALDTGTRAAEQVAKAVAP